ncbi:variant leucine-rich repeat-containing protein [Aeromicrobium sp. Sec7.5]|uniref:variant leucine-rich repeat-containing protein n=1 Tax=Aeromicrobium sp. Sec7.5 TaxID=3121276 RepID=UPI002FE4DDF5
MATEQTRHEAADPQTSPARLQELTGDPELWALIAANPSAYDSLVAWLGENGGADVHAAIAGRTSAGTPPSATPVHQAPVHQAPVAARSGGSTKGLWITLGVLVFLLLSGGISAGVWALTRDGDTTTTSDDEKSDTGDESDDRKTDTDEDTQEDEPADLDCDDLSDLEDAADDLTYYYPGLDDEEMLEDATAVIEQFENYDDEDVVEVVEVLLTYAETIAEDEDAVVGPEWDDALDAKFDLMDYVFEEC